MEYLCFASQCQTQPDLQLSWRIVVFSTTEDSPYSFINLYFNCFSPFIGMLSADEDLVSSAVPMPVFNTWLLQFCNSTVDFTVLYIWFCDLRTSNQDNAIPKKYIVWSKWSVVITKNIKLWPMARYAAGWKQINWINYPANKGIRSLGMLFTNIQLRAPHPRVHGSFFQAFAWCPGVAILWVTGKGTQKYRLLQLQQCT